MRPPYKFDVTKEDLLTTYGQYGNWPGVAKHYCVGISFLLKKRRKLGMVKAIPGPHIYRKHGNKKRITHEGYWRLAKTHPLNHRKEECLEHVIVMERLIGRRLNKGERVHHIDGDRLNNDINNLYLCDNKKHFLTHWSGMKIIYSMLKNGEIGFNRETGEYFKARGK